MQGSLYVVITESGFELSVNLQFIHMSVLS